MLLKLNIQRFAPQLGNLQINFDSHIKKVVATSSNWTTTYTWTTSGEEIFLGASYLQIVTFNVTLDDGYVIDNVTLDTSYETTLESKNDKQFTIKCGSDILGSPITITSKQQTSSTTHKLTVENATIDITVNGISVTSPYTLQNNDKIVLTHGASYLIINGTSYTTSGQTISLSDTDINVEVGSRIPGGFGITINYTETSTPSSGEIWVLDKLGTSTLGTDTFNASFKSKNTTYSKIVCDRFEEALYYDSTKVWQTGMWTNEEYKNIAFDTPPTGSLLTWLQNNGTKQGSTPTYKFKHWKKSNVVVNRTLVGEKYYYFKPYTILGLYRIDTTLTNCTGASANATKIQENGDLTLTFTANSGYELPTGVSVTNVTSYNWNKATGVLAISKPTGDVSIEIVAVSALPQLTTPTNVAVTDTTLTFDEVANATSYEVFVDNVSIGTHTIPSVISLKWKFNGTKVSIPQRSYDNSFAIGYDVYNNDTLVESNLHYVYFNDNYTYMAFGSAGYWDTTNNQYGGGNIILFKTEPSGFLLQFLQEHCEALN